MSLPFHITVFFMNAVAAMYDQFTADNFILGNDGMRDEESGLTFDQFGTRENLQELLLRELN